MVKIDMKSILSKAESYMASKNGTDKVNRAIDEIMLGGGRPSRGGIHTPEEVANKFINVLCNEINGSGLSSDAIDAISDIQFTSPRKILDNTYLIRVYFAGDLSRPSLDEEKYGRINDIVNLLNDGVDHTMRPVHGIWHGHETWSKTVINGAHFLESAVSSFKGNYASDYNVVDIMIERS